MKDWFSFVFGNKRLLNFGFLFNFFSSFGQTFFISLFVPYWVESFKISNAAFGSMYATVTIISAFLLSLSGRYIDQMSLKKFGYAVFSGLMVSVILLSQARNMILLMTGLLLVRWFGQGLMTHTSSTGIAKKFNINRGKALGFTALGHPVGQFASPLLILPLITMFGWRQGLIYLVITASLIVIPAIWAITPVTGFEPDFAEKHNNHDQKKSSYFASLKFWIIAANIFIIPLICTAVFLYQYQIGKSKGWEASWVAFSFASYAIFNALALLISGNLVDRFTGRRLFPLYLLPAFIAMVIMAITNEKWVFPLFYALLGIASGLGSTIKTTMLVEVYGTSNLGKIRSYFSTLLVLSTALGPPAFGYLIDHDYSFSFIMLFFAAITAMITALSFTLWKTNG